MTEGILPLTTQIITLAVGPDKQQFSIHEGALVRSPVFRNMISPRFQEGITKHINLPEDLPEIFSLLADWLYIDRFNTPDTDPETFLSGLYLMADKYELPELQKASLNELRTLDLAPKEFFDTNYALYTSLARPDEMLREFFKKGVVDGNMLVGLDGMPIYVRSCLLGGGELALDVYWCLEEVEKRRREKLENTPRFPMGSAPLGADGRPINECRQQ